MVFVSLTSGSRDLWVAVLACVFGEDVGALEGDDGLGGFRHYLAGCAFGFVGSVVGLEVCLQRCEELFF